MYSHIKATRHRTSVSPQRQLCLVILPPHGFLSLFSSPTLLPCSFLLLLIQTSFLRWPWPSASLSWNASSQPFETSLWYDASAKVSPLCKACEVQSAAYYINLAHWIIWHPSSLSWEFGAMYSLFSIHTCLEFDLQPSRLIWSCFYLSAERTRSFVLF